MYITAACFAKNKGYLVSVYKLISSRIVDSVSADGQQNVDIELRNTNDAENGRVRYAFSLVNCLYCSSVKRVSILIWKPIGVSLLNL